MTRSSGADPGCHASGRACEAAPVKHQEGNVAERKLEAPAEDNTGLQEATCDPHKHQGTPRHERARLREARKHRGTNRGNANLAAIRWVESDSSLPRGVTNWSRDTG